MQVRDNVGQVTADAANVVKDLILMHAEVHMNPRQRRTEVPARPVMHTPGAEMQTTSKTEAHMMQQSAYPQHEGAGASREAGCNAQLEKMQKMQSRKKRPRRE